VLATSLIHLKPVVVVKPAQHGKPDNPTMRGGGMRHAGWDPLPEALMRTCVVDVVHVLREQDMEVSLTEDQQVVQAFTPHASHKPFTRSVRSGCLHGCVQNCDSSAVRDLVEHGPELVVIVPYQEARTHAPRRGIPQLLCYPRGAGWRG